MGKILIAPDSFKDSISSIRMVSTLSDMLSNHKTYKFPMADGGEHTLAILEFCNPELKRISHKVEDPIGREIEAYYLFDSNTQGVYIELAQASGIERLRVGERNCMHSSTFGTGQLMRDAVDRFPNSKIYLFVGSSSTNDAGTGIAEALGAIFYDKNNSPLLRMSGEKLSRISRIDRSHMPQINCTVACDVTNPLYGPEGAAYTYARQKGASDAEIEILDSNLRHFAWLIENELGHRLQDIAGGGAAGGVGAGMLGLADAKIKSGFEIIQNIIQFEDKLDKTDLLITGEGCLDTQSKHGKLVSRMVDLAKKHNVPVLCICGVNKLEEEEYINMGIARVIALSDYSSSSDISEKETIKTLGTMSEMLNVEVNKLMNAAV